MLKQATPYLIFPGNAKEALNFYKTVFEGEISSVQTFGEADMDIPEGTEDRILHARFKKDELFFMVSDSFGPSVQIGEQVSLVLEVESHEEIQIYYDRLINGGKVLMELQDTFWGATYAKVQDPFNIVWDLNYTKG
ncbi:VOC family protein [Halobacillus litoralis]|uniref:VOC family protein n=1 Tax=Halobacillus litoralis TaxID=45668 RepID=UPI001CFC508C|nr:VOC family protein [Halobacillus litoralis]